MDQWKAVEKCRGSESMAFSSNNDLEAALSIKGTFLKFPHLPGSSPAT